MVGQEQTKKADPFLEWRSVKTNIELLFDGEQPTDFFRDAINGVSVPLPYDNPLSRRDTSVHIIYMSGHLPDPKTTDNPIADAIPAQHSIDSQRIVSTLGLVVVYHSGENGSSDKTVAYSGFEVVTDEKTSKPMIIIPYSPQALSRKSPAGPSSESTHEIRRLYQETKMKESIFRAYAEVAKLYGFAAVKVISSKNNPKRLVLDGDELEKTIDKPAIKAGYLPDEEGNLWKRFE